MAIATAIVVGTGGFARGHIRCMLRMPRLTRIVGFVEPSEEQRAATRAIFDELERPCPPFCLSVSEFVKTHGAPDTALICSPHKYHFENARDCLKNGIDTCIEKPMVMNASEARRLIKLRDQSKRLVVVAFPGSLSPAVQKAKLMLAKGDIGTVTAISAFAHQHWKTATAGTWRQIPEISGGGFLFDTGSHMINTVVDLLQEDIVEVSSLLDNLGAPVEINSSVSAKSSGGVMVSLCGAGDSIQCASQIMIFGTRGLLVSGIWGERLQIKRKQDMALKDIRYKASRGAWDQFMAVRNGKIPNPCPPEVGLRFAKLMDMIRRSAETGKTVRAR